MLKIEATDKSPSVILDENSRFFEIEGNSRPEDVREFYEPVINELKKCLNGIISSKNISDPFKFSFKLGYYNSASAKYVADILMFVTQCVQQKVPISVDWYYENGDEDMKGAGEDFSEMTGISFNFIPV